MKKIVMAVAMLAATGLNSNASDILVRARINIYDTIDKVAVRPEDLPESVKSAIASGYSEWKVSSAFLVTKDDHVQYYEVNIKKTDETATVNFDKYGKKLD